MVYRITLISCNYWYAINHCMYESQWIIGHHTIRKRIVQLRGIRSKHHYRGYLWTIIITVPSTFTQIQFKAVIIREAGWQLPRWFSDRNMHLYTCRLFQLRLDLVFAHARKVSNPASLWTLILATQLLRRFSTFWADDHDAYLSMHDLIEQHIWAGSDVNIYILELHV